MHRKLTGFALVVAVVLVPMAVASATGGGGRSAPPRWIAEQPMPWARGGLGAALGSDGLIYAISGRPDPYTFETTVAAYDPLKDTWSSVPPIPVGRYDAGVTAGLDGRIYVIGGYIQGSLEKTTRVDVYSPTKRTWQSAAPLPVEWLC